MMKGIQERSFVEINTTNSSEETSTLSATTRSKVRQVRFADELIDEEDDAADGKTRIRMAEETPISASKMSSKSAEYATNTR